MNINWDRVRNIINDYNLDDETKKQEVKNVLNATFGVENFNPATCFRNYNTMLCDWQYVCKNCKHAKRYLTSFCENCGTQLRLGGDLTVKE